MWKTSRRHRTAMAWGGGIVLASSSIALALVLMGSSVQPVQDPSQATEYVVVPRPLEKRLAVVGTIRPGSVISVTAPFDGIVKEKQYDYGARVKAGQILLAFETTDIDAKIREAAVAALRAERSAEELSASESPEVLRAKRGQASAQLIVDGLTRKEEESRLLLERGIIPRSEHESLAEQLKTQQIQLEAARQELDNARRQSDARSRRMAALELDAARKQMADLNRQRGSGKVVAPVDGLILRPDSGGEDSSHSAVEVGSRVTRGQPLFTIADGFAFDVAALVDEIDINAISEGQQVEVSGDALGAGFLSGHITRISSQAASHGSPTSKGSAFEIVARIDGLTNEQRRRIRFGMSATLSLVTYRNPSAIVLPSKAIQTGANGAYVLRRSEAGSAPRAVSVQVLQSTQEGVEVGAGIRAGDKILVYSDIRSR